MKESGTYYVSVKSNRENKNTVGMNRGLTAGTIQTIKMNKESVGVKPRENRESQYNRWNELRVRLLPEYDTTTDSLWESEEPTVQAT
jgi:hypothetical protein